jgi:putative FmdB family regulatory protein
MPTYDYICYNCEHEFEKFQPITARPLRKCPQCGKNGLKRLIGTGAGVIFKGSGFYETDYRSESYKQAQKKETEPADKKAEDKKDTKPKEDKTKESKAEKKPKPSGKQKGK